MGILTHEADSSSDRGSGLDTYSLWWLNKWGSEGHGGAAFLPLLNSEGQEGGSSSPALQILWIT